MNTRVNSYGESEYIMHISDSTADDANASMDYILLEDSGYPNLKSKWVSLADMSNGKLKEFYKFLKVEAKTLKEEFPDDPEGLSCLKLIRRHNGR